MTVKEFINLAVILIIGLLVNHCAFDNDVTDLSGTRISLDNLGERFDQKAEEIDRHMNEMSEKIDENMQELDEKMNKMGENMDMDIDIEKPKTETESVQGVKITSTRSENELGNVTIAIVADLAGANAAKTVKFQSVPKEMLVVLDGTAETRVMLNLFGGTGMESPEVADEGAGRINISFSGAMPNKVDAIMPPGLTELVFGGDKAVRLTLEPTAAVLHLDSAVEKITTKRSGDWVTLTTPEWTVRLKGFKADLRIVNASGSQIDELKTSATGEITVSQPGEDGGAQ